MRVCTEAVSRAWKLIAGNVVGTMFLPERHVSCRHFCVRSRRKVSRPESDGLKDVPDDGGDVERHYFYNTLA